jgi:glutathione S-transferase
MSAAQQLEFGCACLDISIAWVSLAVLLVTATKVPAQEQSSLTRSLWAAITELDAEIAAAEAQEKSYDGGLLATVAALNTETLRLTRSVIKARKAAEETGAPIEISVPAVPPDPKLAAEILADIQAQQKLAEEARVEAEGTGGLMAAMALTRYETERLSLAQLRQAWYRAQYGIAFPSPVAPAVGPAKPASEDLVAAAGGTPGDLKDAAPAWADSAHPYRVRTVALGPEQRAPEHLARQPFGQAPAIEEDGLVLFESGAIALHVAERSEALLPKHPVERARAIAWLFSALNSVEIWVQELAVIDLFHASEAWTRERRPQVEALVRDRLAMLQNSLGRKDYLEGRFTVGDLMMADVLRILRHTQLLDAYPTLKAYKERCEARPAFQRAMAAQMEGFGVAA